MKTKLTAADRITVNELCAMMMQMNDRNDTNTAQSSTYGHLSNAIVAFVRNQTGVNILNNPSRYGWNLGGNNSYADDIQVVIDLVAKREELLTKADAMRRNAGCNSATNSRNEKVRKMMIGRADALEFKARCLG